ncbi:MAG: hypothetical protein Q8O34_13530 [Rhodocyclaceae bacterium]|nr:hypothetical protein [Rhodocyclaceae bacterium]
MPRRKPARPPTIAYQTPDQEDARRKHLRRLREAALEVMELLADFRPYLTGAVLDGTADRHAEVDIELFADSAKEVEISLLSRGIPYEPADNGRQYPGSPEARLRMDWDGAPIRVSVYPALAERRQRRGHARARAGGVEALLVAEQTPSGQIVSI